MRKELSPSLNGRQGYTAQKKFGNLMAGDLCGFHNGLGLPWSFAIPLVDRLHRRPGAVECIHAPGTAGHGAACGAIQRFPGFTSSTLRPGPSSRLTVPRISADKIEI